jgi:hypothetical protein
MIYIYTSAWVSTLHDSEIFPVDRSGRPDKPYTFKIFTRTMPNPIEVAVDSEEQISQWLDAIDQCTSKMAGEVCNAVQHVSVYNECTTRV